jgi:hypothetical protein
MGEQVEAFVGLDVAKAVAMADEGRTAEVRYFGEIDADPGSVRRMVAKLEKPGKRLYVCYYTEISRGQLTIPISVPCCTSSHTATGVR